VVANERIEVATAVGSGLSGTTSVEDNSDQGDTLPLSVYMVIFHHVSFLFVASMSG
jgi:hypothetical protein